MADNGDKRLLLRTLSSLDEIDAGIWNRLANPESVSFNPFISHEFLSALETSGSAVPEAGWYAQHIVVEEDDGDILGVAPSYLKAHSRGEYVFDYGWAEAYERAGGRYYPKLLCAVPFTPVTGERFLVGGTPGRANRIQLLAHAMRQLCGRVDASSFHINFVPERDCRALQDAGWLRRTDTQFHWINAGYDDFGSYLSSLTARKRKNVRKERKTAVGDGITVEKLTGSDLAEHHWDAFYAFYLDTGGRKWGSPYLTRDFFSMVGETLADNILLIMARRAGRYIAGALNFIGGDALYGRNWGALEHHDCLHFELCYYQAIDHAIRHGLKRVEAGAQGAHKLARGYLPVTTHSLHYLADPRLSQAVADYLEHERTAVSHDQRFLGAHSPFRNPNPEVDNF